MVAALSETFAHLAFYLFEMGIDAVDGAIGGDKLLGSLLAHARATGDIVGRVAPKAEEVDHLVGTVDAEMGLDIGERYEVGVGTRMRTEHGYGRCDELGVVLIGRDHEDLAAVGSEMARESTYDIVGLEGGS